MDIAILQSETGGFDIALGDYDLKRDEGLRTAVLISLLSDRRASDDDVLPDGGEDRRGYWADAWPDVEGDRLGSRLWLLSREKQTADVLQRAETYAEEALAWLVEDGIASRVEARAQWVRSGVMQLTITIRRGTENLFQQNFDYELRAQ
ncbi:MAG: hypothetical protein D6717_13955 [Gammaproteobacteria bacterium]|nr:MAG: hypothetical protein D6717_13955 [Gammaproteobacteria bacterium]